MQSEISSLQSYLRENARLQYETISCPPFTLFFHAVDSFIYFNYAIPDTPDIKEAENGLFHLLREFRSRSRTPRFEFFEEFAPTLPSFLLSHGFKTENRQWTMLCTPQNLQPVTPVPDLTIHQINANSSDQDVFELILTQRQGFNPQDTSIPGEAAIKQARLDMDTGGWTSFLARLEGQPAAVATFGRIIEKTTEITGIATRVPYRRRGIAAFLSYWVSNHAFKLGAQFTCLTAQDETAGRVYQRGGYSPFAIMLSYILEAGDHE